MNVRSPPPLWLVGRSARIAQNPGKDGVVYVCGEFRLLNESDVNAVIVESESKLILFCCETVCVPLYLS